MLFQSKRRFFNKDINLFGYKNNLDKINKTFDIGTTYYINPIGSGLVEFLNFNFDEFKDYFTKYFGKYYEELTTDEFYKLESSPSYTSDKVISLAKKYTE